MNEINDLTHGRITVRLIADALELQQHTRQPAHLVAVPGTGRVIAIGTPAEVAQLLEVAPGGQPATDDIHLVLDEVARATRKFPTWPTDPLHAVAVLGEEFGELTKAVLQTTYEPHKVQDGELRTEAVQTAAMAIRFLASLDRYKFARCPQHVQPAMSARRCGHTAPATVEHDHSEGGHHD